MQTTACAPSYKFTGYERDPETGLDYAFARYYSSRLGRFLSTDPLGGGIGNLQSHNAYAYTVNNPTNLIDPIGLSGCPNNPNIPPGTTCGPPPNVPYGGVCGGGPCDPLGTGNAFSCSIDGVDASCGMALGLLGGDAGFLDLGPDWKYWGDGCYSDHLGDSGLMCFGAMTDFLQGGSGGGGGRAGSNPCQTVQTLSIGGIDQRAQLEAGLGYAVTEISFAATGDINGFNLVVGPAGNVNISGATLQAGSSVSASFNGQQLSIGAVGGNILLSQPGSSLGGSISALAFQKGAITSLSGNATLYGIPIPWTSDALKNKLNATKPLISGLHSLQNFLGKCASSRQGGT